MRRINRKILKQLKCLLIIFIFIFSQRLLYIPTAKAINCTCTSSATPAGLNGECKCPNDSEIYTPTGCVAETFLSVCKTGQVSTKSNPCRCASGATPTGEGGICQCLNGISYDGTDCPTSNICKPGQISTSTNPCVCAGEGVSSSTGCRCLRSKLYTVEGCLKRPCDNGEAITSINECFCANGGSESSLFSTTTCKCGLFSTTEYTAEQGCSQSGRLCEPLEVSNENNQCICPRGATFDSDYTCKCLGLPYTGSCLTTRPCRAGEVPRTTNPCSCKSGGTIVSQGGACQCTNGQAYTQDFGCTPPEGACSPEDVPDVITSSSSTSSSGGEPISSEPTTPTTTEQPEEPSTSNITLNPNFTAIWKGVVRGIGVDPRSKLITLKLCVVEDQIEGSVQQGNIIEDGVIISQNPVSENEVTVEVADEQNQVIELNLILLNKKRLKVEFIEDGFTSLARRVKLNKECAELSTNSISSKKKTK